MASIIRGSVITEKSTIQNAAGVYVFKVDTGATKLQVKTEVENLFNVKVKSVRTLQCRAEGKKTKAGMSKAIYWKKALVKLSEGQKIALFEGV